MRTLAPPVVASAVLALAACTAAPAPVRAPAPAAAPAAPAAPTSVLARLVIGGTHTSIDVAADGIGAEAVALCEAIVDRELDRRIADLTVAVARPCIAAALPARAGGPGIYLLSPEPISTAHLAVQLGGRPVSGTGVIARVSRMPTEDACRQARAALVAERARLDAEAAASARRFLVEQLQVSDAQTQDACDRARTAAPCAPSDGMCVTARDHAAQDCAHRRDLGNVLRSRLAQPPAPSTTPPPRCVVVR